jgi:hypothetical protein
LAGGTIVVYRALGLDSTGSTTAFVWGATGGLGAMMQTAAGGWRYVAAAATGNNIHEIIVAGEANERWIVDGTGKHYWGAGGGSAVDVTLYRSAADKLKTDDMMLAALGIGVGNSAAATTPGSVVKKIQVFDASGASLGYVAVYDAIT